MSHRRRPLDGVGVVRLQPYHLREDVDESACRTLAAAAGRVGFCGHRAVLLRQKVEQFLGRGCLLRGSHRLPAAPHARISRRCRGGAAPRRPPHGRRLGADGAGWGRHRAGRRHRHPSQPAARVVRAHLLVLDPQHRARAAGGAAAVGRAGRSGPRTPPPHVQLGGPRRPADRAPGARAARLAHRQHPVDRGRRRRQPGLVGARCDRWTAAKYVRARLALGPEYVVLLAGPLVPPVRRQRRRAPDALGRRRRRHGHRSLHACPPAVRPDPRGSDRRAADHVPLPHPLQPPWLEPDRGCLLHRLGALFHGAWAPDKAGVAVGGQRGDRGARVLLLRGLAAGAGYPRRRARLGRTDRLRDAA